MSHLRDPTGLLNTSPRPTRSSPSLSPGPSSSTRSTRRRGSSSASKENEPILKSSLSNNESTKSGMSKMNGHATQPVWRDGSLEPEDHTGSSMEIRKRTSTRHRTKSPSPSSPRSNPKPSPSGSGYYNGLPTLPPISDQDADSAILDSPTSEKEFRPPPPAPSALTGTGNKPITRKRRSSSIKRKPSPGVRPVAAVDWEIPRKTLHSSIGFLVLFLYHLDPPTVRPLVITLSAGLLVVTIADYLRFTYTSFRDIWENNLGFLMRESEREKVNGVVYYLIGVIFVLVAYPREVAVVSILTLSWSDTTASTIGRLWGKHTPPLPPHLPFVPAIKFAPRKSLAGFLAATFTGMGICFGFWWNGSGGKWGVLDASWIGLGVTAGVVGVGGAVVEALDLGLDDNLTLPILTGAIIWTWLSITQLFLG